MGRWGDSPPRTKAMAKVWVQLKTAKSIPDRSGKLKAHQPGDWVEVRKHTARQWLANGTAHIPDGEEERKIISGDIQDCGVVVRDGKEEQGIAIVGEYELPVMEGGIELPYNRTLIWRPPIQLAPRQVAMGFARLEKRNGYDAWEVVAMLRAGNTMAHGLGSIEEREVTKELLGDLRLPLYECGAIWARRNDRTDALIERWRDGIEGGVSEEHAFIRALYHTPLLVCTLPAMWLSNWWVKEQQKGARA